MPGKYPSSDHEVFTLKSAREAGLLVTTVACESRASVLGWQSVGSLLAAIGVASIWLIISTIAADCNGPQVC